MKRIFTLLATMATAFTLHAAPITGTLTLDGFQYGSAKAGTMTYNAPGFGGIQSTSAGVGGLLGTFTTSSDPLGSEWLLWCIELFAPTANFGQGVNYTQNTPGVGPLGTFSAQQQSLLEKLFVKQVSTTGQIADDVQTSAAVQLAIWEILYSGAGFGNLHTTNNAFQNTNAFWTNSVGGARTEAESILSGLDTFDTTGWNVTFTSFNNGGSKGGKQDFLSANVEFGGSCQLGNECAVPEPTPLALAGVGLLALGFAARRKKA